MKIGIICEGGPNGADRKVYEFLAKQISPEVKVISVPLDSKPKLIDQCGKVSKALLELSSCEQVIIIWDLQPAWGGGACRYNDCQLVRQSLSATQLDEVQLERIHLVCMEQELETLFLTDEQIIARYLTQKSGRPCKLNSIKHPEDFKNAKKKVSKIFEMHSGKAHPYNDMIDAEKMLQFINIKRLKACPSFVRFAVKITYERRVSQMLDIPLTELVPERAPQEEKPKTPMQLLTCPFCNIPLEQIDYRFKCANSHSFDI